MFHTVLLLCFWGALAVNGNSKEGYSLRLAGGGPRCRGQVQLQRSSEDWIVVHPLWFSLELGDRVCAELDCGSALTVERKDIPFSPVLRLQGFCSGPALGDCFKPGTYLSDEYVQLNCSDSVRLVSGQNMCSGSLQIRDSSLEQSWTPVCEGEMDSRGAEVVCRQLGCGAPVLQGALSTQAQMFYCEGNEPSLLDCPRTCPGPPLNLTCSEPLRLVGGASRCEGTVEVQYRGEWRRILSFDTGPWDLGAAAVVCQALDCGNAVSTEQRGGVAVKEVWLLRSDCVKAKAKVRECVFAESNDGGGRSMDVKVVCSGKD